MFLWNWIAAAAPAVGVAACLIVASGAQQGSGLAGGIGSLFRGALVLAAICAAGEGAAIAAIAQNERPRGLSVALAVLNLLLILPGLWVLIRMDWD